MTLSQANSINHIEDWFLQREWQVLDFQRATWQAYLDGKSGMVHAPTGHGKTLAVWGGVLADALAQEPRPGSGMQALWITPMRALANDTLRSLQQPIEELNISWACGCRTGDTPAKQRNAMKQRLPEVLVTTPESLSLLLSYPDARSRFCSLQTVVVDEWHELLASKRGNQTELCLARLRQWQPHLKTWGLSATLGNTSEALQALLGTDQKGCLLAANSTKETIVECLVPDEIEHFPWSGHLGIKMLKQVAEKISQAQTSLLFTNTRSQCEIWFEELRQSGHEWSDQLAIHHGSIDRAQRLATEAGLADGSLRCVICTSSLDLGVDFSPVEQVFQVGSPKGVARLLQRAGRSGHQPGLASKVICVPTNALELIEFAAARKAIEQQQIEPRIPISKPLDVLAQHLVTCALGGGFSATAMLAEVRSCYSYSKLSENQWQWVLEFITHGGSTLKRYRNFHKVTAGKDGIFTVPSAKIARLHRMSIGTINSDSTLSVKFANGKRLGGIEEWFLARLSRGDSFRFAGKSLELVRITADAAVVKLSSKPGSVAVWMGGRMPLSSELADSMLEIMSSRLPTPEASSYQPLLDLQQSWSAIPCHGKLVIEQTYSKQGEHAFIYPFAGRLAHEGLAMLLAHRISLSTPITLQMTSNDYGFQLSAKRNLIRDINGWRELLSTRSLLEDLLESINSTESARRKFRDIAKVAGLLDAGFPGSGKRSNKSLQASGSLLYEVFSRYDPDNLLMRQARREVLEGQLDFTRIKRILEALQNVQMILATTSKLTPLAFPLWAEQITTGKVSSQSTAQQLAQMLDSLEHAVERRNQFRPEEIIVEQIAS